jgi:hypothetical protein
MSTAVVSTAVVSTAVVSIVRGAESGYWTTLHIPLQSTKLVLID